MLKNNRSFKRFAEVSNNLLMLTGFIVAIIAAFEIGWYAYQRGGKAPAIAIGLWIVGLGMQLSVFVVPLWNWLATSFAWTSDGTLQLMLFTRWAGMALHVSQIIGIPIALKLSRPFG
jgi:membrane protein YdbS with pleckstrin-like domain